MWFRKRKELEKRINQLENDLLNLRQDVIWLRKELKIDVAFEEDIFKRVAYGEIHIVEAFKRLLDHLGIGLSYSKPTKGQVVFTPYKKNEDA
jgi:hypothetical protein